MTSSKRCFRAAGCLAVALAVCALQTAAADKDKPMQQGLVAHYFRDSVYWNGAWPDNRSVPNALPENNTFTTYAYSRVEPLINHHFVKEGWFSVRWVGDVDLKQAPRSKNSQGAPAVVFKILADDGCRLFVDGVKVIDSWIACWEESPAAWRSSPSIRLDDGPHRIVVEYFQGQSLKSSDVDPIKLYWVCPDRGIDKPQIIPAACFSHQDGDMTSFAR